MLKVLLTSTGSLAAPEIISTLKKDAAQRIHITGVDTKSDAVGFKFVDKFFTVPFGNNNNYVLNIKKIIENERIDVVIPCSDEELVSLSKHKKELERLGTKILCNDYKITKSLINKGELLTLLSKKGFPTAGFFLPKDIKEVKKYARRLGYPQKPLVIKPVRGRGGRGFTIVCEKTNFFRERNRHKIRLNQLINELKSSKSMPNILMMEYLGGDEFSVDVLAENGKIIYAIPRRRIETIFGPSLRGEFSNKKAIVNAVKEVTKILKLDLIFNMQFKYLHNHDSQPYITEINPRPGATIALNSKAGIPLLLYGIRHVLGLHFPKNRKVKLIKFWRYYHEYYEKI